MRRSSICLSLALSLGGIAAAQEMELQVALTSPLGTQTSHKGDRVTGQVTRPDSFKGDTVEGRVTEVRSGSKIRGTSSLNFTFETLQHAGQEIPISSQVASLANSKGQTDVDEEGRVIRDDFIPGEKVLLYDDFSDMASDEAPPHWKVRGAALSLMQAGTVRQVTAARKTTLTPMVDGFPKNFTLESEVLLQKEGCQGWHFFPAGSDDQVLEAWTEDRAESSLRVYIRSKDDMLNDSDVPIDFSKPVKQALWVQNGRLRFYLTGRRWSMSTKWNSRH